MIAFIIFIVLLSIIEVYTMKKNQLKRELILYSVIALITLVYGIIYFSNPYQYSFSKVIIDILKLK
ncbi:MAG: hypothetical protein MJA31_09665 [Clostridia bacterium]|nr:hypothetical protein [Clostridia bacterium]